MRLFKQIANWEYAHRAAGFWLERLAPERLARMRQRRTNLKRRLTTEKALQQRSASAA